MEVLELNGFNVDAAAQALKQGQTGTRAEKKGNPASNSII